MDGHFEGRLCELKESFIIYSTVDGVTTEAERRPACGVDARRGRSVCKYAVYYTELH